MSSPRKYYSIRTGTNPFSKGLDLSMTLRLFNDLYREFEKKDYFQEAFGFECVDRGRVPGSLGFDVDAQLYRRLRKTDLFPISLRHAFYSEDDLFDIIEILYDFISKPLDGFYHGYNDCGMHYETFDRDTGRNEFREEINQILCDYGEGYELSKEGEIQIVGEVGLNSLFNANIPGNDDGNINLRIQSAINKFRRHRSSLDDRKEAIRELADVLEYVRPKLKNVVLKQDDADLFNIINNFGIRHHNQNQRTDYDQSIWYSWLFYYFLASIHAVLRLIEKDSGN